MRTRYNGQMYPYWRELFYDNLDVSLSKLPPPPSFLASGLPGHVPIGYRKEWENGEQVILPDGQASLVEEAFSRTARELAQPRSVWQEMQQHGLLGRTGKPISEIGFMGMLANPFYLGLVPYRCELFLGSHPPLVDETTWKAVQETLAQSERETQQNREAQWDAKFYYLSHKQR